MCRAKAEDGGILLELNLKQGARTDPSQNWIDVVYYDGGLMVDCDVDSGMWLRRGHGVNRMS
jgi:hypothetical protein